MFFSDVIFLWLPCLLLFFSFSSSSSSSSFRSSPAYGFSGVPLVGRAVVNGASEAVSALRASIPDAKPWLAATVPVAPLCRAVACAPGIPAKGRRDVRATPFRKPRFTSLRRVPAHCLRVPHTRMSPCRRG